MESNTTTSRWIPVHWSSMFCSRCHMAIANMSISNTLDLFRIQLAYRRAVDLWKVSFFKRRTIEITCMSGLIVLQLSIWYVFSIHSFCTSWACPLFLILPYLYYTTDSMIDISCWQWCSQFVIVAWWVAYLCCIAVMSKWLEVVAKTSKGKLLHDVSRTSLWLCINKLWFITACYVAMTDREEYDS